MSFVSENIKAKAMMSTKEQMLELNSCCSDRSELKIVGICSV